MKSFITIWILAILTIFGTVELINYTVMPAGAIECSGPCSNEVTNDKALDACTGQETAGRCADKPAPSNDQPTPQVLGSQTLPNISYQIGGK